LNSYNKGKKQEKGKAVFEVISPAQSGILLQGMVQSLLYFKGNPSLVLAGINLSKVLIYEHVKK